LTTAISCRSCRLCLPQIKEVWPFFGQFMVKPPTI
jgi:hypothetical protein